MQLELQTSCCTKNLKGDVRVAPRLVYLVLLALVYRKTPKLEASWLL